MTFIEKLQMIDRLHYLILKRGTGSANELSIRLNISRRNVYNIIEQMKVLGAPIEYCGATKSFIYKYPVKFESSFSPMIRN